MSFFALFVEKVETTIDEAQRVVDIVEDVAEGVDKVAEEAVKHLPDGKLRDAVEFVEKVAEDIDKHAERAEDELEKAGGLTCPTPRWDNGKGRSWSAHERIRNSWRKEKRKREKRRREVIAKLHIRSPL
ncbi:hypothetical protein glysoja_032239 [Glycine soja]|uniref:Uncharacterized protein n=1 Tax=Glycine soja TaxID=3848 RepID=A0A0B2RT96_GLYSO|nr:hypothetical protein glysoja_032239 [Glycine soja]